MRWYFHISQIQLVTNNLLNRFAFHNYFLLEHSVIFRFLFSHRGKRTLSLLLIIILLLSSHSFVLLRLYPVAFSSERLRLCVTHLVTGRLHSLAKCPGLSHRIHLIGDPPRRRLKFFLYCSAFRSRLWRNRCNARLPIYSFCRSPISNRCNLPKNNCHVAQCAILSGEYL